MAWVRNPFDGRWRDAANPDHRCWEVQDPQIRYPDLSLVPTGLDIDFETAEIETAVCRRYALRWSAHRDAFGRPAYCYAFVADEDAAGIVELGLLNFAFPLLVLLGVIARGARRGP